MIPPSSLITASGMEAEGSSTVRGSLTRPPKGTPKRALSPGEGLEFSISLFREWPRLPFTARIERALFHRARSASKKGTWPLPSLPLEQSDLLEFPMFFALT